MSIKVQLNFESPLIVGDKRLTTNYIESKDYIQGSVIRAAFVKSILNHCSAYHGEAEEIPGFKEKKKNWVYYRGKEVCKTCKYSGMCKKFGENSVKFSFFYPEGTSVIPLTSMICKNNPKEHGFIDSLTQEARCPICHKYDENNSRVEFTSGLRGAEGEFKVARLTQTKTAINPYTKTSLDGQLYSLTSVVNAKFVGEIEGLDQEELELFKILRVGAYTSTGYGKCKVSVSSAAKKQITKQQVEAFSKAYIMHQNRFNDRLDKEATEEGKHYIALLLTSDAQVDVKAPDIYQTTEEYQELWDKYLDLPIGEVHKIYLDTTLYRGYDTSADTHYRGSEQYHIYKGGVIVVEVESLDEAYEMYKTGYSIGNQTLNGYGQCELYCGEEEKDGK